MKDEKILKMSQTRDNEKKSDAVKGFSDDLIREREILVALYFSVFCNINIVFCTLSCVVFHIVLVLLPLSDIFSIAHFLHNVPSSMSIFN